MRSRGLLPGGRRDLQGGLRGHGHSRLEPGMRQRPTLPRARRLVRDELRHAECKCMHGRGLLPHRQRDLRRDLRRDGPGRVRDGPALPLARRRLRPRLRPVGRPDVRSVTALQQAGFERTLRRELQHHVDRGVRLRQTVPHEQRVLTGQISKQEHVLKPLSIQRACVPNPPDSAVSTPSFVQVMQSTCCRVFPHAQLDMTADTSSNT